MTPAMLYGLETIALTERLEADTQIASKRYSNIIVTLAQTLDKRLSLTLVER